MHTLKITQTGRLYIILFAFIAALGGFILGFDAGVIVDGKDQISHLFSLSDYQWSLIVCASISGSLITILISGRFIDKTGAKVMLLVTAAGYVIGLVLTANAHTIWEFVLGRFVIGMCIGVSSFSVPLFISDIAPTHIRGSMILVNSIAITAGQAIAFLMGYFLHDITLDSWRIILWTEAAFALCFFLGMIFMPQSPRWVSKKYGLDEARVLLSKIRGGYSLKLEQELNDMDKNIISSTLKSYLTDLFSKKMMPVLILGVGLGVLQQFVGINAVMYYGPVIFQTLGFSSIKDAILATFFIGLLNLIFTIISAFLVDYAGRRILLLLGTFIAAISMLMIGSSDLMGFGVRFLTFLMAMYMIGYCISLGSLFWVVISEIYPQNIRGLAMSFVTGLQLTANLIVTITFFGLFNLLGKSETFSLYGIMSLIAFIFVYFYVPETKGVSLELIEANLNLGKKTRKLGELIEL